MKFKGIPIFRILDYKKACTFYIDFLGFKIDWEHRFGADAPVYMQVSMDNLTLQLSETNRFQTGSFIYITTTEIENFRKKLLIHQNAPEIPEISITPWNTKQLEIQDPFGNFLRFNENINPHNEH